MKVLMFHLMPYREVAETTFADPHENLTVAIPSRLFDPVAASRYYAEYLDEIELGATCGFDGVCVNEHHQMAYGMMPSPNIILGALARRTAGVALVALGTSVALYNPPTRVAEEYAMLDCISGGRIVAGFPVGTVMDSTFSYGTNPALLRERYHEAVELIVRAWTEPGVFSFDGRFTKLRYVNIWPRPYQRPHPPVWVPGGSSVETWSYTIEHDFVFAQLSYGGYQLARRSVEEYWRTVERAGAEPNPYRMAFLQLVCVGDSDAAVEQRYGPHVEHFFNALLPPGRFGDAPGYRSLESLAAAYAANRPISSAAPPERRTWADLVSSGAVVAGTADAVAEELAHLATSLNVGHLLLLPQIGSLPHEVALDNIARLGAEVVPRLAPLLDERGFVDHWWPSGARA